MMKQKWICPKCHRTMPGPQSACCGKYGHAVADEPETPPQARYAEDTANHAVLKETT